MIHFLGQPFEPNWPSIVGPKRNQPVPWSSRDDPEGFRTGTGALKNQPWEGWYMYTCTVHVYLYIYIIIYNTVLYVYIYIVDMTWYDWYRNMLPQKWSGIQNRKPASEVNWPLTYYMIHAADIYLTRWPLKKRSELCMCLQCSIQIRRGFLYYGTIWYPIAGW